MRKLNIIFALLLSLLLISGAMNFPVFALEWEPYTLSVDSDKDTANAGETVEISVVLEPGAHISAITLSLLYDPEYFEYQNDAAVGISGGNCDINDKGAETGEIVFSYVTENSLYNEAARTILMTASFKVKKINGAFDISLKTVGADNFDTTDVTENGQVQGITIGVGCAHENQEGTPWQSDKAEHWQICSLCGETINKGAHTYGEWTVVKEPTETEEGQEKRVCTVCKREEIRAIPALNATPRIIVSKTKGRPGAEANVTVSLENNPGIAGMTLGFDYDKTRLEAPVITEADLTGWTIKNRAVWATNNGDVSYNGVILNLKFKVKEDAPLGEAYVTVTYDPEGDITNWECEDLVFEVVPGEINVVKYTPGDINDDGKINSKDFVTVKRYLSGDTSMPYVEEALDVNGDGKINSKDFVILKKYLAGESVILH